MMVLEWLPIAGAVTKSVASTTAGKLAGVLLEKGKAKLFPGELERALFAGMEAAQASDNKQYHSVHLFYRCDDKQQRDCLSRVMEHPATLTELRKPLESEGVPDVACLKKVFEQVAQDLSLSLVSTSLEPWAKQFAETYFEKTSESIRFQVARSEYLKQLAERVNDVKFVGIAVPGEEVEKQEALAQIFVMPDVRQRDQADKSINSKLLDGLEIGTFESSDISVVQLPALQQQQYQNLISSVRQKKVMLEQRSWATRDSSSPRIPAPTVLSKTQKKAVLLGAPGSGKTILVSYFALMLCEEAQSNPTQIGFETGEDWLPIVVQIRDWILQPKMGLLEYLRWYAEESLSTKKLPQDFFEYWLDRGRALILLDGLDEVVDEAQRRKIAEYIETFLRRYQDNPAVITSRPAGYRWDFFNLDEFPHYTLESFSDQQVTAFIDHWYDSRIKEDKAKADRRKADLKRAFEKSDRVKMLAKNPLLLTIIALIHRYQAELPRQRYRLYEKAVETLLTSWDSGKEIKLYEQILHYLKPDDLLYVIKKLAYWIHTQGNTGDDEGGTLIDQDEFIRQLSSEIQRRTSCKFDQAKAEAKRLIGFIQKRTGLLNEQGRDRYAFVHKTFQEYLTAEEIYDRFEEGEDEVILEHIQAHLHDQHWREVLLLLVSRLKKKRAEKAIKAILNASSPYERWLKRDLLFAGWCLTEDPEELKSVASNLVGDILDRFIQLEISDAETVGSNVKQEATAILHRLGETALEKDSWECLQAHSNKIDGFRLLNFQASLGQAEQAISTLLELLQNPENDADVLSRAAYALGRLGHASPEVVDALLQLLQNPENDMHVRSRAAFALGELGHASPEVVDVLLQLLQNPENDMHVRYGATSALGQLGHDSSEVVDALLQLLQNPENDSDVRSSAAFALGELGHTSPEVVDALLQLLQNPENDSVAYSRTAFALGQLGYASSEVVNALLQLLQNPENDANMRSSAAFALGQLGHASSQNVDTLLHLLQNKENNADVRYRTAFALGQLGHTSPEVVDTLLQLIQNPENDANVRSSAAFALGELGHASPEVVNTLLQLLQNPENDANVRSRTAFALGQLGHASPEVVNTLLQLLQNPENDADVRYSAAFALGQLGHASPEVVNTLLQLLQNPENDVDVSYSAADALGQLGKRSKDVLPALVQWLDQQAPEQPVGRAIDALWSIVSDSAV